MKDLIILGAGGLAKELVWLVEEINDFNPEWNILGYLDSHPQVQGIEMLGIPVLGGFEDFIKYPNAYFIVAFGDAGYRREVVEKIDNPNINWATLISPTVRIHSSNKVGDGVVISRYSDLTVDCEICNHVMLNIHVVIGHNVTLGKYSIVSPNVTINGGATIGEACSIGANAFVRDIIIGNNVVIGASSCVVKPTGSDCVFAGVPAKFIRQGKPKHSVTTSLRERNH